MALLSDLERALATAEIMEQRRDFPGSWGAVTKVDIRSMVNGADQYLEDNAGPMNTAIPQPARANTTAKEKALAYMIAIAKRYLAT
jgi:hypothetical protein